MHAGGPILYCISSWSLPIAIPVLDRRFNSWSLVISLQETSQAEYPPTNGDHASILVCILKQRTPSQSHRARQHLSPRDDDMIEKDRQLFAGALCDVDSITRAPAGDQRKGRVCHGGMHGAMIVSALMLLNADATAI